MITLNLLKDDNEIVVFDGTVLEVFTPSNSDDPGNLGNRIHIAHVENIELKPSRKGDHYTLVVKTSAQEQEFWIDQATLERANALISEVQRAKAAFQF